MVVITGSYCLFCPWLYSCQVPRKLIGTDGFQETPIVEVTRAITKHNYLVMDIEDLPRVMKEVRASPRAIAACCCLAVLCSFLS
jgi:thiamine pyrophosphate-dependent acetolactate synthase large subunit-like protein